MCEEALKVLAKVKPGVEIRMCDKHMTTVKLHYAPWVVGVGPTLSLAIRDCFNYLLEIVEENPVKYVHLTPILKELSEIL